MNKPKIILAAICLFAAVGGAFAYKAKLKTYYYFTNPGFSEVAVGQDCAGGSSLHCTTAVNGVNKTLYTYDGNNYITQFRQ